MASECVLVDWPAGGWFSSARASVQAMAGLRAAYRLARLRRVAAPWMLLVDAGVVGVTEVASFKVAERRAERVGAALMPLLTAAAAGRPVYLIGHSLGARVVHHALLAPWPDDVVVGDAVLLAGAADWQGDRLGDWPACVGRLRGRLYNVYSPRDRVLRVTPDTRRRVGQHPLPEVVVDGEPKLVNHLAEGVGHAEHWTRIDTLLPVFWPGCR